MPFRFNMLLEEAGIDPAEVRVLRHAPTVGGRSLLDIWRTHRSMFEHWQRGQLAKNRARFRGKYWAAFIGTWDGRTVFVGLYRIGTPETIATETIVPFTGAIDSPGTVDQYPAERDTALESYEAKLYIDWGGGASGKRAWVQRADAQDKPITELRLEAAERPFPGVMELAAPLSTLSDAPSDGRSRFRAAAGSIC